MRNMMRFAKNSSMKSFAVIANLTEKTSSSLLLKNKSGYSIPTKSGKRSGGNELNKYYKYDNLEYG